MSGVEDKKKTEEAVGEEEYRESEDEDYNPDGAKEEKGEEDSDDDDDEDFEDGENKKELEKKYQDIQGGGLIKTRRQQEEEEKKGKNYEAVDVAAVKPSVDIDAIWAQMKSGTASKDEPTEKKSAEKGENTATKASSRDENGDSSSEYITITRTYRFAGEVHQEEKRVHRNSGEAQDYLKQQKENSAPPSEEKKRPPPRRKKRSSLQAELDSAKAKKMNTLEKSRLDWLGFVDQEGIKDQLTHHNKGGYLHKQDFLSRVEHNLEESRRQAAKKN
ncbi:hypothetical protein TRICI_006790 [Trichomonascus ciferrii]|uniref:SWR1-complex protein 5 n=1 Tax=Trichomonascus ciferrii TaxID=44093 RepID=A0A642UFY7_9ASCO|nr:hypothetical protein TRICI_006790 [Trichomonascus ciferrii]